MQLISIVTSRKDKNIQVTFVNPEKICNVQPAHMWNSEAGDVEEHPSWWVIYFEGGSEDSSIIIYQQVEWSKLLTYLAGWQRKKQGEKS